MARLNIFVILALICAVSTKPVDKSEEIDNEVKIAPAHNIEKRFINPSLTSGSFDGSAFSKMRTKRSEDDECEKLRLCRLHARANRNFFSAFELYFVNKENARQWDHQGRSLSECDQRFSCYK